MPGNVLWDNVVKGLHLRVRSSGQKFFALYYRTRTGIQRRPKIGRFGDITLADARRRAKAILDLVAAGQDPSGDWQLGRQEMTLGDFFYWVHENYYSTERFHLSGYSRDVKLLWEKHLKDTFAHFKLNQLQVSDVTSWHARLRSAPTTANRSLSVLSKLLNMAEEKQLRPLGSNPCRVVRHYPERSRRRFATETEMRAIAVILEREWPHHPNGVAFLWALLFTGSRPRALERAMWEDLTIHYAADGKRYGVLSFNGKSTATTGRVEEVVFPDRLLCMIESLPRRTTGLIFNTHMPHKLWRKIREEIGAPDLWARDLRRTFATVGLSSGVAVGQIGELLNHSSSQTTKIYAKLSSQSRVQAATRIAKAIEEITASIG